MNKCNISLNPNPLESKMALSKDEDDLMRLVTDDLFEGKKINVVDLPYYVTALDLTKAFLMSIMTDKQKAYHKELMQRYRLLSIASERNEGR